ncbi:MAG TPA: gamma-glutamyl-gamma-aminobutyrate hydrolase family protein [Chryseosolibacter sp.]|nr:gamma-glutamyl-gamma-aminobutyrate hydrolase family protein [Chryseosolibacter sp.]
MKRKITIGITDCSKYENYRKWIEQEKDIAVVRLSHDENNFSDIAKCDGIVLSGGEDVHPRYYNKTEYFERCQEVNETRDDFELRVLDYSEKNQLPLLGICRGLQIANIYFGGTLLPHIPDYGKFDHSRSGPTDRYHTIQVDPNSLLKKVVGAISGEVNSAHHQAADRIGKGLVANALSPDGVVEGLERESKNDHSFLLLVQWHPERMNDQESVFTKNIKTEFLEAARR